MQETLFDICLPHEKPQPFTTKRRYYTYYYPPPPRLFCGRFAFSVGFTLIEISIVIVIIGLLIGAVLVGRDLIEQAKVRAAISQIEKYKVAVNTFRMKYGYLPGDLPEKETIAIFGELPWSYKYGNGNGILNGQSNGSDGEYNRFWIQLANSGMIEGKFALAYRDLDTNVKGKVSDYVPHSKLGEDKYVHVRSGGVLISQNKGTNPTVNYFTISGISRYCGYNTCGYWDHKRTVMVSDAYTIDSKIDDGLPQSGKVQAFYRECDGFTVWANGRDLCTESYIGKYGITNTVATPASDTNCYDNNNVNGAVQKYSVKHKGGAGRNCALAIQFN